MEEKRKDLKNSQRKRIVQDVVQRLASEQPSLYYMPTIEVAAVIKEFMQQSGKLSQDELALMKGLSRHDIQILLSLH